MTYARGSEWGRWDLHVHTPESLVHEYGKHGVDPWEAFLSDLERLPPEFRVIGINDYLFLDGYRRVQHERLQNGRLKNIDLVLPLVELRLHHFGGTEGRLSRVNLHVLFSDEIPADVIQAQFINGLRCNVSLLPGNAQSGQWSSLVTRESLSALGAAIKSSLSEEHLRNAASDLTEGFNNYNVSIEQVHGLLDNPVFRHKHFVAVGKTEWADVKWTRQSVAFKKTIINEAHFVFTAADTPASFQKSRASLIQAGVNATLLDCSDAHHLSDTAEQSRIGNCLTWINSVPSFEGLRHAYHEYETRVFVGDMPPKLGSTRYQPTHHIDSMRVEPDEGVGVRPTFDTMVPLNPGFVAIVGNKGRGKSALTDVLGMLGDCQRSSHYSFLNSSRFANPKNNLAAKHVGTLTWLSGSVTSRRLNFSEEGARSELVQYLPQSFLEKVCNEGPGVDALFSKELGDVIFSHVPEAARLGTSSLEELVAVRTEATSRRIEILRGELSVMIAQILTLEELLDPATKRLLESRLRESESELQAHELQRPAEVLRPSEDAPEQASLESAIEAVRMNIVALDKRLKDIQVEANEKSRLLERSEALQKELDTFDHQYQSFVARVAPTASDLGIDIASLVSVRFTLAPLTALAERLKAEQQAAVVSLSVVSEGSPARQAVEAATVLSELEADLAAPQRAYQAYLSQLAGWQKRREELVGSPGTPDTLEHHRHALQQVASAPDRLEELRARRTTTALEIHAEQAEMAAKLRDIYEPVQEFINDHPVARDRFNLSFEVTIVEAGFEDRFFAMIHRQVNGSFAGTEEGSARLRQALAGTDFNSPDSVAAFLTNLDADLRSDNRAGREGKPTLLSHQLRRGATAQRLLELVFGLEYLSAEFWLRSDEKPMSQLSPGQRGTLLLLFYLLVDKSSRPIILDQPEENLDNQTVHELLVPAITEARKSRQVIAVTHNPNLAVVGDADQVIVAEMTEDAFAYVSGAIEDPEINVRIVSILEGTWPAFQNRRDKYIPTSVLELERP